MIEMCWWYDYDKKPICKKGHKASLKCHSVRKTCIDYLRGDKELINKICIEICDRDKRGLGTSRGILSDRK